MSIWKRDPLTTGKETGIPGKQVVFSCCHELLQAHLLLFDGPVELRQGGDKKGAGQGRL